MNNTMKFPIAFAITFVCCAHLDAVITRLIPLSEVIEHQQFIILLQVEKFDPEYKYFIAKVMRTIKGKWMHDKIHVRLTGNDIAKKNNDIQTIADRLDYKRIIVLFIDKRGRRYPAVAFVEGSWFSLVGVPDNDDKNIQWYFLNGEPYLRRTFHGTSDELIKIIEDYFAGNVKPPAPDPSVKPGYGPPVERKPSSTRDMCMSHNCLSYFSYTAISLPAVIPSFVLIGPLAIIAAIFPGIFVRLAVIWRKWRNFLIVASINTTLALAYYFISCYITLDVLVLNTLLVLTSFFGLLLSGIYHRRLLTVNTDHSPISSKQQLLLLVSVIFLVIGILTFIAYSYGWCTLFQLPMREFTYIIIGLSIAASYVLYTRLLYIIVSILHDTDKQYNMSHETVGLIAVLFCNVTTLILSLPITAVSKHQLIVERRDAEPIGPLLLSANSVEIHDHHGDMNTTINGQILSRIVVDGTRCYFGVALFGLTGGGRIICADAQSGRVLWSYDGEDLQPLLPVYCTPLLADGILYCGEGLHENSNCRLFALDAQTGKPRWEQPVRTASHTEGQPTISSSLLIFPAGDDGLYAVSPKTGEVVWHVCGGADTGLHVDGAPVVHRDRVFVGTGVYSFVAICLDAATGREIWRAPLPYRSFSSPLVMGDYVYYAVGTGNLGADTHEYPEEQGAVREKEPAGAVVCFDSSSGRQIWRADLPRGAHAGLAGDAFNVYATCRDGCVYAFHRGNGQMRWRASIGSAITSAPAIATINGWPIAVYAVSREGVAVCLNPHTGDLIWQHPLPGFVWDGQETTGIFSGPTVIQTPDGLKRTIYIGGMTIDRANPLRKRAAIFQFVDSLPRD